MSLPEALRHQVERALAAADLGTDIARVVPVGGGCIHHGTRVETGTGAVVFLKWNSTAPVDMFEAEADGLQALRGLHGIRIPEPIAWGGPGPAWLLMEWIEPGRARRGSAAALGRALASLHAAGAGEVFGWPRDNFIGSLPQENPRSRDWATFWRDARLAPQLAMARRGGHLHEDVFDSVLELTQDALADITTPALLHGDLWGGNAFTSTDGEPVLVDPAVYVGDGEVDLAMSELFGGFDGGFYSSYRSARGLSAAYSAYRRDLYQLYYLLVHVNLFGSSYATSARSAAERVRAVLG